MIDYVAVFDELKGYSGWVVLEAEQDPKKAPALPYAEEGRRDICARALRARRACAYGRSHSRSVAS